MRYWVLGLVPSPGKTLPDEVDRCLTGARGIIHLSEEPLDYQKKKKREYRSTTRTAPPDVNLSVGSLVYASDA
ncbi:hypothetical protein YC2023_083975 [Brassica napus]